MTTSALTSSDSRRRKRQAILAAGTVLGIGAAVTLATWNDTEYATGEFEAGAFNLEGNIEGSVVSGSTGFAYHPDEPSAAAINFDLPSAGFIPGDRAAGSLWIRLDEGTVEPASLVASDIIGSGVNADNFSYQIFRSTSLSDFTCTPTHNQRGTLWAEGSTLHDVEMVGSPINLEPGATADAAGTPVRLCVVMTAGPVIDEEAGLQPEESATGTWTFTGYARDDV